MLQHVNNFFLSDNLDEMSVQLPKSQPYLCMLYCRLGSMQVQTDGQPLHLTENDLLICQPEFLFGHYMRTPDLSCHVICVTSDFLKDVIADCLRSEPQWLEKQLYLKNNPSIHLNEFQQDLLDSYFRLLTVYLRGVQDTYRLQILHSVAKAAILEIMSYLDLMLEEQPSVTADPLRDLSQKDVILKNFLELLRAPGNLHRDVNWYAEQLNITPKYLSAVCKDRSGKTASRWISDYLVDEIKSQLLHSDKSVKEVGYRLGFSDTSFFCQYVRKHLGKTPVELRKSQRGEAGLF